MEETKNIEKEFADIIIQRPHEFKVGRKRLYLYPLTLAKTLILKSYLEALELDMRMLGLDPHVECLRLVETKKDVCSEILAIHATPNTRKDLYNLSGMRTRRRVMGSLKPEHLAALLMIVLTSGNIGKIMSHYGMEEEREHMAEVIKVKKKSERNTLTFGGKTLIGTFICQLKEMGYRDEEIVFEQSYDYLQLVLADRLSTIYLSNEEMESVPESAGGKLLDGDDPDAMRKLEEMIKGKKDGRSDDTDKA